MNGTGYQCRYCGFKWMEMGRPRHEIEFEKALRERFDSYRIYILLGIAVWFIASFIQIIGSYLFLNPPVSIVSNWFQLLIIVLGFGATIGWAICLSLRIAGRYTNPKIHIRLPLLFAAIVGALQGIILYDNLYINYPKTKSEIILIISGILLALAVTPVIIVRGSKLRKRKGYGAVQPSQKDPRWNS